MNEAGKYGLYKMKRQIISIVILFAVSILFSDFSSATTAAKGDSLTISEALEMALHEYPSVRQSVHNWEASLPRVELAKVSHYPTVDIDGSYTRLEPLSEIQIPHSPPMKVYPEDNYDIHVVGRYTLYDFGRANALVDVSSQRSKAMRPVIEVSKSYLAIQTVQAFYSILFYQYSIAVQNLLIENLEAHKSFTEKQVETGSATDFDELTTTVRIDVARSQLSDLENNLQRQEISLRRLLGIPAEAPVKIAGIFSRTGNELNVDSAVAEALQYRPELVAARAEETATQLQKNLLALSDLPTLGAVAQYGFRNGLEPNLDAIRGNMAAGVQLHVPIYNGKATRYKVDEAEAMIRAAHQKVVELEKQIAAEVRQSITDLHTTRIKLETAHKQVEHAQAAVDNADARYRSGTIRNIELLDAETGLTQMKLLQIQSEYAYTLGEYALAKAMGRKYWQSGEQRSN